MTLARRSLIALLAAAALADLAVALSPGLIDRTLVELGLRPPPHLTLEQRLALIGPGAVARLKPYFDAAHVPYPPAGVTLVGLKAEKLLQLYARGGEPGSGWRLIRTYPVLAASGHLGPKLREGDKQVPEGIYGIDFLNPNSLYNVSMRVTYPNDDDRANAAKEGRSDLGGAIMIHGRAASIGCLAMGDPASEELFTLVADVGMSNVTVILAPVDFRRAPRPVLTGEPNWVAGLYDRIEAALKPLPLSDNAS